MQIIQEADNPQLFRSIEDQNLIAQYNLLKTSVEVAISQGAGFRIDSETISRLNYYAVVHICATPGAFRTRGVGINASKHQPPLAAEVPGHMNNLIEVLDKNWAVWTATRLAAYALWRLCWIHPFAEGNGRTARALACLVLCTKLGMWLPGKKTIPEQIRETRPRYYKALECGDQSDSRIDFYRLDEMDEYLKDLLVIQLQS